MKEAGSCQSTTLSPICLLVTLRALQFFLLSVTLFSLQGTRLQGAPSVGETYSLSFVDIDGEKVSVGDGHVTVLVMTTPADREQARTVSDRIPEHCLGNPDYRMITVIRFTRRHLAIGRKIATALIRHRINDEATRLQARYNEKGIKRDARKDIFIVTDFDGSASSQLSDPQAAADFLVFVFGRNGELLAHWQGVPSAEQLDEALK